MDAFLGTRTNVALLASLFIGATITIWYLALRPLYNIFLHPLHKYPGPKLYAASQLPWGFRFMSGRWHIRIKQLHEQYGPIVRVGPNELAYAVPEAWDDVYGRYVPGKRKENPKPRWYCSPESKDIVGASLGDHGRMRRLLNPGFTNGAMLEQEPLIKVHVDLFLRRLVDMADNGKADIDIFEWFAYCTFDMIGELSFGEPFGCLEGSMMHPWITWVFANIKLTHILLLCKRIPFFFFFLPLLSTRQLIKDYRSHQTVLKQVCDRRMALEKDKPDFMQHLMSKKGGISFSKDEIYSNAILITLGGAETTSNTLSGSVFLLATHPRVAAAVFAELHSTFKDQDEINLRSASKLLYLNAVIEETLRFYPPGPNAMWRMTPPEGNNILGEWIPGNTVLSLHHRVLYRSEQNWVRPDEFLPERWLKGESESEFSEDRRDSFHPFSYGPRSCLAMNLAYAEMRFILARLMWTFDVQVAKQSLNWMDEQKAYLIWEKPGLHVHLTPRSNNVMSQGGT